jgi:hypothetical protein
LSALVGVLGNATEESEDGVGDASQDGDDQSATRVLGNLGVVVFSERAARDLMRRLDAPVPADDEKPIVGGRAIARKAGDPLGWHPPCLPSDDSGRDLCAA